MKRIFGIILLFCFVMSNPLYANEYVLPYPSNMPGSKLYRVMEILDRVEKYWSWGNIAQFRYQLALADKKIVEAKTLIEYKQYLLADTALKRSNSSFEQTVGYIVGAYKEGKDITHMTETLTSAATKHSQVLNRILGDVPSTFLWSPEKSESTLLSLQSDIERAIQQRQTIVNQVAAFVMCTTSTHTPRSTFETIGDLCWETKEEFLDKVIDDTTTNDQLDGHYKESDEIIPYL